MNFIIIIISSINEIHGKKIIINIDVYGIILNEQER